MKRFNDRFALMRVGVACAVALVAATMAPRARGEEVVKSFSVTGRANVRVETNDAGVRVTTSNTKQVEFRVEYQNLELNKNFVVDSRQDGDRVQLKVTFRNRFHVVGHWCLFCVQNNVNLRIEVRMPQDADLQVESGDGAVEAYSINGTVNVHTGDGSVKASQLKGSIDLHTNDGSITVDSLKGDIRLRTGDGSIEARDIDGKVEADSGDGHIRIAGRFDALNVKTGDGSVDTHVQPGSKMSASWTIHTGDGSVDIFLPADFQANIDATTGDGHISLGIPVTVEGTFSRSQVRGKMNGGGMSLTIHTGDGSIRLSKS